MVKHPRLISTLVKSFAEGERGAHPQHRRHGATRVEVGEPRGLGQQELGAPVDREVDINDTSLESVSLLALVARLGPFAGGAGRLG